MTENGWRQFSRDIFPALFDDIREMRKKKKKENQGSQTFIVYSQKYRRQLGGKTRTKGRTVFIYISRYFIYRSISWINALVMRRLTRSCTRFFFFLSFFPPRVIRARIRSVYNNCVSTIGNNFTREREEGLPGRNYETLTNEPAPMIF